MNVAESTFFTKYGTFWTFFKHQNIKVRPLIRQKF